MLLLSAIGHFLGLFGAFILTSILFRSRTEDIYNFSRVQGIIQKTPHQYRITFTKTDTDEIFKIAFKSKEFNKAYEKLLARLSDRATSNPITEEDLTETNLGSPTEHKDSALDLAQSDLEIEKKTVCHLNQLDAPDDKLNNKSPKTLLVVAAFAAALITTYISLPELFTLNRGTKPDSSSQSAETATLARPSERNKKEEPEKQRSLDSDLNKEKVLEAERLKRSSQEDKNTANNENQNCDGDSPETRIAKRRQLISINLLQNIQSKINILLGERWEFPVQIGDSRDHTYLVLGNPTDNKDSIVSGYKHLNKKLSTVSNDTQYWSDEGIVITFENHKVASIELQANETWLNKPYTSPVAYGVRADDTLQFLCSKLGPPYSPKAEGESKWGSKKTFEWRVGNLQITRSIITEKQNNRGKTYSVGDNWGGLHIADLRQIVRAEQQDIKDRELRIERITLSGEKLTTKEIFRKYSDRIFIVTSYNSLGKATSQATAVLYRKGVYLTNYHVIRHARKVTIKSIQAESEEVEVLAKLVDKLHDWAVLDTVIDFSGKRIATDYPEIHTTTTFQPGEDLVVIGNPQGLVGTVTTGIVSALRTIAGAPWIQISAPISEGSSGSPVFNQTGQLIGLATSSLKHTQNLNLATPIAEIIKQIHTEDEKQKNYFKNKDEFESALAAFAGLGPGFQTVNFPLNGSLFEDKRYSVLSKKRYEAIKTNDAKLHKQCAEELLTLTSEYPDPEDEDTLLDEAQEILFDLEDFANVDKIIGRRISINPNNYKGFMGIALLLKRTKQLDRSKFHFEKAINMAQSDLQRAFDSAKTNYEEGGYEGEPEYRTKYRKEDYQKELQKVAFQHATDALNIGKMYFELFDYENSKKWFTKARSWAPSMSSEAEYYLEKLNKNP